jgi:hypothetical protein
VAKGEHYYELGEIVVVIDRSQIAATVRTRVAIQM